MPTTCASGWRPDGKYRGGEDYPFLFKTPGVLLLYYKLCRYACRLVTLSETGTPSDVHPGMLDQWRRGMNLLICGGTKGVGKTRLCQGICAYSNEKYPRVRGIYHNVEHEGPILPSDLLYRELEALEIPAKPGLAVSELVNV